MELKERAKIDTESLKPETILHCNNGNNNVQNHFHTTLHYGGLRLSRKRHLKVPEVTSLLFGDSFRLLSKRVLYRGMASAILVYKYPFCEENVTIRKHFCHRIVIVSLLKEASWDSSINTRLRTSKALIMLCCSFMKHRLLTGARCCV